MTRRAYASASFGKPAVHKISTPDAGTFIEDGI
jgi:hypothetical protein